MKCWSLREKAVEWAFSEDRDLTIFVTSVEAEAGLERYLRNGPLQHLGFRCILRVIF